MPWPIGSAALQGRLKDLLGIRGAIPLELDEQIVPVVSILEAERGPVRYPLYGTAARTDAAVVGQFSHVGVSAGRGTILVVDRVTLVNNSAGAQELIIGLDSDPVEDAGHNVICVNHPNPTATTLRRLAARCYIFTNAAQAVSSTDSLYRLLPDTTIEIAGPPWVLYNEASSGQQALVITPTVANVSVTATFHVREYDQL